MYLMNKMIFALLLLPFTTAFGQKNKPQSPPVIKVPMTADSWEFSPGKVNFENVNGVPAMKIIARRELVVPKGLHFSSGTIEFDMGPRPSRWGTSPSAVPPSLTTGSEPATPIADRSGAGKGTVSVSGSDGETLVDNDSGTQTTVAGDGWVEYRFSGSKVPVSFYTLTNGADGRSPSGWVVKGSNDGTDWKVLDRRSGEKFDWQQATRPFKLESESRFSRIRIEFTGSAAVPITLSEVELLG